MTPEEYDEYVRKLVDEAPPLTPYQRDLLVTLLRGAGWMAPEAAASTRLDRGPEGGTIDVGPVTTDDT